jgi:hypothetical protein
VRQGRPLSAEEIFDEPHHTPPSQRHHALAVLQAIMLISLLALTPAQIIAQDGGAADQPPTDMLVTTDSLSAEGGIFDGTLGWALWVLLTATIMVSGALVIRRQRASDN